MEHPVISATLKSTMNQVPCQTVVKLDKASALPLKTAFGDYVIKASGEGSMGRNTSQGFDDMATEKGPKERPDFH